MNSHILAELAEFQRQELIADATRFRPRKSLRAAPSRVDRPCAGRSSRSATGPRRSSFEQRSGMCATGTPARLPASTALDRLSQRGQRERVTGVVDADYLVVGAGAMGMAFTDALIDHADVSVVMVDRRHGAGGALARRVLVRPPASGIGVLRRGIDPAR